jgi:hypothetical protein
MELIREYISAYYIEIIIGLAVGLFLLLISTIILNFKIKKSKEKYNAFVQGCEGINVEELFIKIDRDIRDIRRDLELFQKDLSSIETKLAFAIQKVGFIRYNAFNDMGSELSFSIVLMDNFLNGFVITSIYGRDNSVSYAKPVKEGKSNIPLSAEELIAIERAIKGENIEFSNFRRAQ